MFSEIKGLEPLFIFIPRLRHISFWNTMMYGGNCFDNNIIRSQKLIITSKCLDPLTSLTLIYDSVTLPIMFKGMYRKSSRKIARVKTALNDELISSWNDDLINYACLAKGDLRK